MNKERRAKLAEAAKLIGGMAEDFSTALDLVREAAEGEREAFENLTEGLKNAERGQRMSEVADSLESIVSTMEDIDFETMSTEIEGNAE